MQNAIEVQNLHLKYRDGKDALNGLNLTVKKGEIFSLLGPNGAGKSSLINILTTFMVPTDGDVNILEHQLKTDAHEIRKRLSCVAQTNSIDGYMTLYENMKFQGKLYGLRGNKLAERIEELIATFKLEEYRNTKIDNCSGGIQRKLDIAMSMISSPDILFLDEPTTGMDIESRRSLWELIEHMNQVFETTIFLTTHYLEEAEKLSDRITIIKNGKELVTGSPRELKKYLSQNLIKVQCANSVDIVRVLHVLKNFDNVIKYRQEDHYLMLEVKSAKEDFPKILRKCTEQNLPILGIEIVEPSLDDVFLAIANKEVSL